MSWSIEIDDHWNLDTSVVVPSTPDGPPHASEYPKSHTDQEHNHSDGPYNRSPRDESDEEENQSENNHNSSSVSA